MIGDLKRLFSLGDQLLEGYGKTCLTTVKGDHSPVTEMDLFSHHFLITFLKEIEDLPILSEESIVPYEERQSWKRFWMIDPLDGTKAYIKGKGDFTINVALIENNSPIEGWILSPIRKVIYYAKKGQGVWRGAPDGELERFACCSQKEISLFHSHSHEGQELEEILSRFSSRQRVPLSSAIKFCLVAERDPSCYIRYAGSSEWDIAAGDLIVAESGGSLRSLEDGSNLRYNTPTLRNPPFIALSQSCQDLQLNHE